MIIVVQCGGIAGENAVCNNNNINELRGYMHNLTLEMINLNPRLTLCACACVCGYVYVIHFVLYLYKSWTEKYLLLRICKLLLKYFIGFSCHIFDQII